MKSLIQPVLTCRYKWFYRRKRVPLLHAHLRSSSEKLEGSLAVLPANRNTNGLQPQKDSGYGEEVLEPIQNRPVELEYLNCVKGPK